MPRIVNEHLPIKRLLDVAEANDVIFTLEEFNHLKTCSECFKRRGDYLTCSHTPLILDIRTTEIGSYSG